MNLIDTSTNSPHYFYWKRIGTTVNENLNFDIRVWRVNNGLGVLTIYTNHPGRNLVHKHKTIKLMLWENDPLQSIYKSAQQTEMCREITSPQIAAYFFWSFPFGMARTIWFPIRNFRFFRINDLCVVFLPFVLFVYHILSMLLLLLLFFLFVF